MRAGRWVGLRLQAVFMLRIAVLPPQGDHDSMPGLEWRSKSPLNLPLRLRAKVTLLFGLPVKEKVLEHWPLAPAGISAKPIMSVSRMENLAHNSQFTCPSFGGEIERLREPHTGSPGQTPCSG